MDITWGFDCSNYDGRLPPSFTSGAWQAGARHGVVRASLERQSMKDITRQQITDLQAGGFKTSGYIWCYGDWNPRQTVIDTLALLDGLPDVALWLDLEDVQSFAPLGPTGTVRWIAEALDQLSQTGLRYGIYTGAWCWNPMTNYSTQFNTVPLWLAEYDGIGDLSTWHRFGGWSNAIGKQYLGSSLGRLAGMAVDLDLFDTTWLNPQPIPPVDPCADLRAQLDVLTTEVSTLTSNQNQLKWVLTEIAKLSGGTGNIESVHSDIHALEVAIRGG